MTRYFCVLLVLNLLSFSVLAELAATSDSGNSVMEIMVSDITPATDTLWGAEDPVSEEDWKTLEDAALLVIRSGESIKQGGTGPQDGDWAGQAEWQRLSVSMIEAARQALDAIRKKDIDAMFEAGDAIYQPCESCHQLFNPAVVSQ